MIEKLSSIALNKLGFTKQILLRFIVVALGSQFIYSINALRTVLYDPFKDTLGITNTQIGFLYSIMALVGMFSYIPSAWFADRYSSRKIMTVSLILVGLSALLMTTSPTYPILVLIFISWGFLQEGPFWTSVLKSVRCSVTENKQGTAFGALELLRGSAEFLTNGLAIVIFTVIGYGIFGIEIAIFINGLTIITCGMLCWIVLPEDHFLKGETNKEKNAEVFSGIRKAILLPETWLTGITACGVYTAYVGAQWFVPFLTKVYMMPVETAAIFGLLNTSLTRMIASPAGGIIADNKFGSSVNFMRFTLGSVIIFLCTAVFLPKSESLLYVVMAVMVIVTISLYMLRGVYFAPIGEMQIPKAISGAVLSIAALITYSPAFWFNTLNGYLLDNYSAEDAYTRIFIIMIAGSFIGLLSANVMYRRAKKNQYIRT